jgi:glycosidase
MKNYIAILVTAFAIQFLLNAQTKVPDWAYNATIYEVNVRQFTPEGNFKAFQKHLPRLKELGVDILWLMPIHPIGIVNRKGSLGSYYSVKDYVDVNPEFGNKADFKELVNEIHKLGMYVIIDWVANHTAWDHKWVTEQPDFYTQDSLGNIIHPNPDWFDVADLNYDNKIMRKEMINALQYWVKDFDIDGYRCDVAGMMPTDFWNEVRPELDKLKPVFMLAEWDSPELHEKAFDMSYDWNLYRTMNAIYKGEKNATDMKKYLLENKKRFPINSFLMQFTSNHDENTWNGTEFERLGEAAKMFAVFTYLIPDMPLIYNGQEAAFNKRLDFFEKDLIEWKESKYFELYKKLNLLRKQNNVLWSGLKGGELTIVETSASSNVLAFTRSKNNNKILAVFNFSSKEQTIKINSEFINGVYKDFDDESNKELNTTLELSLKPWSYKIFVQ